MKRLNRVLATMVVGVAGAIGAEPIAQAQVPAPVHNQSVRLMRGAISGSVSDDRGGPLAGAVVSALGVTMVTTVSDTQGRFSIESLPAGDYILQAHLSGFAASMREMVRVGSAVPAEHRLQLRRLDFAVATTGSEGPVTARPIVAAGFGLPSTTLSDAPDPKTNAAAEGDHPHTETAWRLRHISRSVLKDASSVITVADASTNDVHSGSAFGRVADSIGGTFADFLTDLPFSGEVNLLTTSAFAPGNAFSSAELPRGVAYLAIGAPTAGGAWSVRAAMSEGNLSSWLVAGAFASRPDAAHAYNFGLSYSTQDYLGGKPVPLAAVTDGTRNAGEAFAFDKWSIGHGVTVEYGGRYARYDYLEPRGLFSPRVGLTIEPFDHTRVIAAVAQRMIAPGAEEFLATGAPGPWLPPERTFAPLRRPHADAAFKVERARYLDVTLEHEFPGTCVLGVRRFYQDVDNQLVTLFGLNLPERADSVGHYYVANAGALGADGWAVRLSTPATRYVQGSIDYSITRAHWMHNGDVRALLRYAPGAVRTGSEDVHDVTTSLQTEIPETATRVFVLYKVNTAYTRASAVANQPGLDGRFDLQVNQALPFGVGGTQWEILLGIRNLFRDPNEPGSVYDELLVVRPPTRVVGGFLVRF